MIGYRGALRYTQEPEVFALEMRGRAPRVGRRPRELPRDAAVRAHRRRARTLPRPRGGVRAARAAAASSCGSWPRCPRCCSTSSATRQLGIAGISIGSNDLTQLMLGADRDSEVLASDVRRARSGGRRLPVGADPARPRARPADLDLRTGAVGTPRVRRAARPPGHREHLGQRRRRRSHPAADRRRRAAGLLDAARDR